ncbi:MAG: hypothetical protein A2104_03640 [Candidatus Melainabacteria bacterium GWF2_32_7]|nr:MAG: hypothetical protein A2104_03640 [Candidatus Melainabacteria bacterium GWF2_32_7]
MTCPKQNCWEYKKCGREPGGLKVAELGVCPAAVNKKTTGIHSGVNAGRACWIVAGTFCDESVQGAYEEKIKNCMDCGFYKLVKEEESDNFITSNILLEITEKRLSAILYNMPFVAWLKDKEGRFIAVNKPFADSCKHISEDLIGKTDLDIWPRELAEKYRVDDFAVMASGQQLSVEEHIATPEGRKWFATFKTPIFDKNGNVIGTTGLSRNITDHKLYEQELLLKDKLLSATSDAINELVKNPNFGEAIVNAFGVIGNVIDIDRIVLFENRYDNQSNKILTSYKHEWVSDPIYSQIDDISLQNMHLNNVPALVNSLYLKKPLIKNVKDLEPVMRGILERYKVHSVMLFPIYIGDYFWGYVGFDDCKNERTWSEAEKAILLSFAASIASVIERNEKQEKIQESLNLIKEKDALQRLIMESTENGYILFSTENRIILTNNMFFEMFGLPEEAKNIKIGTEIRDAVAQTMKYPQIFIDNSKKIFQTFDKVKDIYELKNGRIIERYTLPLFKDDKQVGRLCNFRDITRLKEIEKLKNEFVSTVSHELRTPLTSIRGSLGLILSGALGDITDDTKDMLDIANNNSIRLISLINDILDIEKIESGRMNFNLETLEILPIIEQAIEENKSYAKQFNVDIVLDNQLTNEKGVVDKNRFLQVLTNLLSNAVKFSPSGETVKISGYKSNNGIIISVKDYGHGIPDEFKCKIFQKFAQSDSSSTRQKGGTGLGLSISKAIVEKMNGEISFETKIGEGTTFFVYLPELKEKTIESISENQTKKILICEDDKNVALLISLLLKHNGYLTDIAYTASQARELLSRNEYNALTLDLILPDDDGISLIYELRSKEKTKYLPILVVSIKANQTNKELIGNLALVDWLNKPIDENKLIHSLKSLTCNNVQNIPNILHVEDDPDILKIVKSVLKGVANISQATTVEDAKVKLQSESYDLLLLDLSLPDGNGLELLPLIEQNDKKVLTVIFSATNIDKDLYKQVDSVLLKSIVDNQKLLEIIGNLIGNVNKTELSSTQEYNI